MIKRWQSYIKTKEDYDSAVSTGYAWVLMPDLPLDWTEAEKEVKVKEEEEIGFIKSSN